MVHAPARKVIDYSYHFINLLLSFSQHIAKVLLTKT